MSVVTDTKYFSPSARFKLLHARTGGLMDGFAAPLPRIRALVQRTFIRMITLFLSSQHQTTMDDKTRACGLRKRTRTGANYEARKARRCHNERRRQTNRRAPARVCRVWKYHVFMVFLGTHAILTYDRLKGERVDNNKSNTLREKNLNAASTSLSLCFSWT